MEPQKIKFEEVKIEDIKFEFPKSVIERYTHAEHEWSSMLSFIREKVRESKDFSCNDMSMEAPKYIRIRYSLSMEWRPVGLAWYLLDEYFKGNITIKKDAQPES